MGKTNNDSLTRIHTKKHRYTCVTRELSLYKNKILACFILKLNTPLKKQLPETAGFLLWKDTTREGKYFTKKILFIFLIPLAIIR
ncbi:hypothetical protein [Niallia sp. FSL K6-0077]|uniref:hypothetical protein n=1 Tax=Niallia sp. FSL K6-0077 TaxID=2954743 RepID=UPI0030F74C72